MGGINLNQRERISMNETKSFNQEEQKQIWDCFFEDDKHKLRYPDDYRGGISQIQFKRDPRDGKFKAIEMNTRPWLSIYIVTAGGINIPYIAYQDVYEQIHQETPRIQLPDAEGIKWINLLTNPLALVKNAGEYGSHLEVLFSLLSRKKTYAIFSISDPLPSIIHIIHFIGSSLIAMVRNLTKQCEVKPDDMKELKEL